MMQSWRFHWPWDETWECCLEEKSQVQSKLAQAGALHGDAVDCAETKILKDRLAQPMWGQAQAETVRACRLVLAFGESGATCTCPQIHRAGRPSHSHRLCLLSSPQDTDTHLTPQPFSCVVRLLPPHDLLFHPQAIRTRDTLNSFFIHSSHQDFFLYI
jgi:hypothetical protein